MVYYRIVYSNKRTRCGYPIGAVTEHIAFKSLNDAYKYFDYILDNYRYYSFVQIDPGFLDDCWEFKEMQQLPPPTGGGKKIVK